MYLLPPHLSPQLCVRCKWQVWPNNLLKKILHWRWYLIIVKYLQLLLVTGHRTGEIFEAGWLFPWLHSVSQFYWLLTSLSVQDNSSLILSRSVNLEDHLRTIRNQKSFTLTNHHLMLQLDIRQMRHFSLKAMCLFFIYFIIY